jgi:TPR repeat protein
MYDAAGVMGLPYDRAKAIEWYRKAAENGVAVAQLQLARKYLIGAGVPEDKIRAQMWFSLAGDQGHEEAKLDAETFFFGLMPEERAAAIRMTDEWLAAHPQSPRPKYDYWFMQPEQP